MTPLWRVGDDVEEEADAWDNSNPYADETDDESVPAWEEDDDLDELDF
jgi:hypothetical protein